MSEAKCGKNAPDFAALHPGYGCASDQPVPFSFLVHSL